MNNLTWSVYWNYRTRGIFPNKQEAMNFIAFWKLPQTQYHLEASLKYRGYTITEADAWPYSLGMKFQFVSDDYDGPGDHRLGYGKTIEECKQEIDLLIEE